MPIFLPLALCKIPLISLPFCLGGLSLPNIPMLCLGNMSNSFRLCTCHFWFFLISVARCTCAVPMGQDVLANTDPAFWDTLEVFPILVSVSKQLYWLTSSLQSIGVLHSHFSLGSFLTSNWDAPDSAAYCWKMRREPTGNYLLYCICILSHSSGRALLVCLLADHTKILVNTCTVPRRSLDLFSSNTSRPKFLLSQ